MTSARACFCVSNVVGQLFVRCHNLQSQVENELGQSLPVIVCHCYCFFVREICVRHFSNALCLWQVLSANVFQFLSNVVKASIHGVQSLLCSGVFHWDLKVVILLLFLIQIQFTLLWMGLHVLICSHSLPHVIVSFVFSFFHFFSFFLIFSLFFSFVLILSHEVEVLFCIAKGWVFSFFLIFSHFCSFFLILSLLFSFFLICSH